MGAAPPSTGPDPNNGISMKFRFPNLICDSERNNLKTAIALKNAENVLIDSVCARPSNCDSPTIAQLLSGDVSIRVRLTCVLRPIHTIIARVLTDNDFINTSSIIGNTVLNDMSFLVFIRLCINNS